MEKWSTDLSVTFPTLVGDAGLDTTTPRQWRQFRILWFCGYGCSNGTKNVGWFRYILGIIFWYQVYQTILGTTHMNAWRLHARSMFELSWDTYLFRKSWILLMILLQECCSPVGGQNCSLSLLGWQQSEGLDSVQYPCWWGHIEFLKRNDHHQGFGWIWML